ncbi:LLM class flavin-dependent oxidoreductase [Pseudomonas sp. LRF_L74]|uniref:LLM class flavin-dependent oxidoreductase n=1 Tax=Pseudomonas sp. LRF_L74 TaxID=3369422 RepID=UPI003F5F3F9F
MSGARLHLNLNLLNAGFYGSAWRWPGSDPLAFAKVEHYVACARIAEQGCFDAVFLADKPGLVEVPEYRPFQSLDPLLVLASIASATRHIGLIATASTSFNSPYDLARRFASLDHLSGGRAGWNVVTTAEAEIARNFGQAQSASHGERYRRADEFVGLVRGLWDSWQDDALLGDPQSGRFIDPARIQPLNHQGEFFQVAGPLNLPRSPQGHPVVVQAGSSADGQALAARQADVVFSLAQSVAQGQAFIQALQAQATQAGRVRPRVMPGLVTVIADTEENARRRQQALIELIPIEYGLARLALILGIDRARLHADRPIPLDLPQGQGNQTMFQATVRVAREENLTARELVGRLGGGGGHRIVVGTPEQVADDIEHWFRNGAADGFNLMPDVLAEGARTFVDEVVPLLRKRGLFRTHYQGHTLREHLGLERPAHPLARPEGPRPAS